MAERNDGARTRSEANGEGYPDALSPLADLTWHRKEFDVFEGRVHLRGSRDVSGEVYFPEREFSVRGDAEETEPFAFGPRGTLYSYSTVHVSSRRDVPYTIGYVDFPEGVRVLCEVKGEVETLACDTPVELGEEAGDWFVVVVRDEGDVA